MNNSSFEQDNEDISSTRERLPVDHEVREENRRSNIGALFAWREVIESLVGKNPKLVKFVTLATLGALYHAYFFYCIYR